MSAVSTVGVTAVGALPAIVIARALGPSGSGAYFVAQSLLVLLTAGATLGISARDPVLRELGEVGCPFRVPHRAQDGDPPRARRRRRGIALRLAVPSAFPGLSVWLVAVVVAGLPFALAWAFTRAVALATDRYEAYRPAASRPGDRALVLAIPGALLYGVNGAVIGITAVERARRDRNRRMGRACAGALARSSSRGSCGERSRLESRATRQTGCSS